MISAEEFVERLCKVGADRGPRRFPRSGTDRAILMHSIVLTLDSSRSYTERQINDALRTWNRDVAPAIETDHVTLRRLLVDYHRLERTSDGSKYRVSFPASVVAFDLEIYDLDLRATTAVYRELVQSRRRLRNAGRVAAS